MTYLIDPRRRITLNFNADEHAVLAADAARAGYASAYAYTMTLVRARGAALRPVVDEHGAQRVARVKNKLTAAQQELAECCAARAADADRCRSLERELAARPGRAEVQQLIVETVARAAADREAAAPPAPTPEQTARAARRAARRGEG